MRIVFDVDGVICDIWTLAENIIRREAPSFRDFSFQRDVRDFSLGTLAPDLKSKVLELFRDPLIFNYPVQMPWVFSDLTSQNKISWLDWCGLFNNLSEKGFEIVLHTHLATQQCAEARISWFEREIEPYAPKTCLICDIGDEKTKMQGNIVIDDCLKNLVQAEAGTRILPELFHNRSNAENSELYEKLSGLGYKSISRFDELANFLLSQEG